MYDESETSASAIAALIRDRICLMGWEPSKLLLTGGADCKKRQEIHIAWHWPAIIH
jgi:hypothetical protein